MAQQGNETKIGSNNISQIFGAGQPMKSKFSLETCSTHVTGNNVVQSAEGDGHTSSPNDEAQVEGAILNKRNLKSYQKKLATAQLRFNES